METRPNNCAPTAISGAPIGYASNGGVRRYLIEAESTTGFVAFKTADQTTLVSNAEQVSIACTPALAFWACASYTDPTPSGHITSLDIHGNSLLRLDIKPLTALKYLDCSYNQLTELSVDGLTELQALEANNNRLDRLDVRSLKTLRVLNCANNRLTELNLSGLDALQILDCSGNPLARLNLDGCTAMQDVKDGKPTAKRPTT